MMNFYAKKLHVLNEACSMREQLREAGQKVVLTNGCFDLLHIGHVHSLEQASKFGNSLWIALNSDQSVKQLKGISRPIFSEIERAYMLSALECVSGVFIFEGKRLANEIFLFKPDVYVKSGDYNVSTLDASEREALQKIGTKIKFVPLIEGISTTKIISAVKKF